MARLGQQRATLGHQQSSPSISGKALKANPVSLARIKLSGSPTTAPIYVPTTPVLIHTCVDYAVDEIYLWASVFETVGNSRLLEVEIGGDGTFADLSKTFALSIDKQTGMIQIYPGVPHENVTVYARGQVDDHFNIFGYVIRHYRIDTRDSGLGYNGTD
tara:strand:+ start:42 stop:518 length:477 start_codon:yes stop_codon:yes gene_type:complete